MEFSAGQSDVLLDAAREAIRGALRGQRPSSTCDSADPDLNQPAGCFVSLHDFDGKLRGCVGRMESVEPLLAAVRASALSVLHDPRFEEEPVTLEELPRLELELSILSPMRPVTDMLSFDLLNDGIYLTIGRRSGLFLPQVARQTGWSREQLLSRLSSEKLGMPPDAWRLPEARLAIFSTVICGPEPFEPAIVKADR
jgi:AmmeMemoRadiSam system protein A